MHTHLLGITLSEDHCVILTLGLFHHMTPVCEEKSSNCQLIRINEGHTLVRFKGCMFILYGGGGSRVMYTSLLTELNFVHMAG